MNPGMKKNFNKSKGCKTCFTDAKHNEQLGKKKQRFSFEQAKNIFTS